MSSQVTYQMGYRASEFGDVLSGPFSGEKSIFQSQLLDSNHWQVRHRNSPFCVDIRVCQLADRELGLFRLPVLQVDFNLGDDNGDDAKAFFLRFHQYFHKGGG